MVPIEQAVTEFRQKRLDVYRADPDQIVRDTHAAERASKDHAGRWLFELVQNCDDARATRVWIHANQEELCVIDNGTGLKPTAVTALCGTDFSDKKSGKIGRKGIGFKSVYEISDAPQVLSRVGGVAFNYTETKRWLCDHNLPDAHVPYPWIPFYVPWNPAYLKTYNIPHIDTPATVVRLPYKTPGEKTQTILETVLSEWQPSMLLTFRNICEIQIQQDTIALNRDHDICEIMDGRNNALQRWHVKQVNEKVPDELYELLGVDERRIIETDGASFLIAAPVSEDGAKPTEDYLPIHVFYPTEQTGPVRLLLHAEFLVKSDRSALLPFEGNPFNQWVASRIAVHVCNFVQSNYREATPCRHAALLVPFPDRATHPTAESLWENIRVAASGILRFPDVSGNLCLSLEEAKTIKVSVEIPAARRILAKSPLASFLLHPAYDDDAEAVKALEELGTPSVSDEHLIEAIENTAETRAEDHDWIWDCWQWLGKWAASESWSEKHCARIERIKQLSIVPTGCRLKKTDELANHIVTWRNNQSYETYPDWLPLDFLDDWFRDRILQMDLGEEGAKHPTKKLLDELGYKSPGQDVVQKAVLKAIRDYKKEKRGFPERFLRYIFQQSWHDEFEAKEGFGDCPVYTKRKGADSCEWVPAKEAYFGSAFKNELLASLYSDRDDIYWAQPLDTNDVLLKTQEQVLKWLGVAHGPRVLLQEKGVDRWHLPDKYGGWKKYLENKRDYEERSIEKIEEVTELDRVDVEHITPDSATFLLRLIALNWELYYCDKCHITAFVSKGRERYYRRLKVKSLWWYEITELLYPPTSSVEQAPLSRCWLPDQRTARALEGLLAVIDIEAFKEDKNIVRQWLTESVEIRSRLEQIDLEEWYEILNSTIPRMAPTEEVLKDESLRNRVSRWYEACLDSANDFGETKAECLGKCVVLCTKGGVFAYMSGDERYLADDPELAEVFGGDLWLLHSSNRLKSAAEKYFGIKALSKNIQRKDRIPDDSSELATTLKANFDDSLPYVFAERSFSSKEHSDNPEKLRGRLKSLRVLTASDLRSTVTLGSIQREISCHFLMNEDNIFLDKMRCNESLLAQALADYLEIPSEADFYENLMRCNDDKQRKEKLRQKGMSEADIQKVQAYHDSQDPGLIFGELTDGKKVVPPAQPQGSSVASDTGDKPRIRDTQLDTSESPPGNNKWEKEEGTQDQQEWSEVNDSVQSPGERLPQRAMDLITANDADYKVGAPLVTTGGPEGEGGTGGHRSSELTGSGRTPQSLTNEQKLQIENCGRVLARRELEKQGYTASDMPQDNPGYDIQAVKIGEERELRVELKTHLGAASVIDLTAREYKEYLARDLKNYDWQLWNIEYLERSTGETPTISKYTSIPDDAIDSKLFRVNLRCCSA